ncbi:MAG TPA: glycosyltransferase family A protein [Bryobacteraceae bacterium]|jgi:hypothetical protein|nr:glycosyltransferase family A protein [Bryobacteraceae bacterium]
MITRRLPLAGDPPDAALQACVAIPVPEDAAHLDRALSALAIQTGTRHRALAPHLFEVLLLLSDSCSESMQIAEGFRRSHPWLRLHLAKRGRPATPVQLRRAVMNEAYRRLEHVGNTRGVILTTDTDAVVAPDWIAQNMAEVDAGADAVGGRILLCPDPVERWNVLARDLYQLDDCYGFLLAILEDACDPQLHDPLPRHHQHYFASLAVTAEAYAGIGGLPIAPGRCGMLYEALLQRDMRVRHSPSVRAFTLRLPHDSKAGVLAQLGGCRLHPGEGERLPVESVEYLEAFFSARRRARRLWNSSRTGVATIAMTIAEVADLAGVQAHMVGEFLSGAPTFGQFLAWLQLRRQFERRWRNQGRFEPIALAVEKLRHRFEALPAERKINLGVRSITAQSNL